MMGLPSDATGGFKVAPDAPAIAVADLSAAVRVEAVRVMAAVVARATPEDIVGYRQSGWPEVVEEMLARPGVSEELSAYVDVLAAVLLEGR